MAARQPFSTRHGDEKDKQSLLPAENEHSDQHSHSHSHSHGPGIFGLHSHGEEEHSHGAEQIVNALGNSGDRGSRVTLIGLGSNIVLTGAKGAAGVYMNSASLLADAGHSLSDLLGDFVTLFCWKLSRKPSSERYPYGFAKFETLGTTTVSLLLIGGAFGIGIHSIHLLSDALQSTASTLPSGPVQDIIQNVTAVASALPEVGHSHEHVDVLDPNAAWFAALGVISKEWLYRITKKVADEEHSPVLLANAYHHRSDAYSSFVALFAILGTWLFPTLPLDPIGGLIVSLVILQQGLGILRGAYGDLTDAGVSPKTRNSLNKVLEPLALPSSSEGSIHSFSHLRARRAGATMSVDVTARVPGNLTIHDTTTLEEKVTNTLKAAKREITEVRVRFVPVDDGVKS